MNKEKSKLWLLVRVQLLSYYGINKALHSDGKQKKKLMGRAVLAIVGLGYFCWISWSYSVGVASAIGILGGDYSTLLALMVVSSSVISLVSGILTTGRTMFSFKSYDQIMSLPVSPGTVAASRIAVLYLSDLLFSLLFLVPAAIVYAGYVQLGVYFWATFTLCTLLTPCIPLVVSAVIGTIITALSTRLRSLGRIVTVVCSFAFILACAFGPQLFLDGTGDAIGGLAASVQRYYPPARLYVSGVCEGSVVSFALFVLASVGLFVLFCLAVSKSYRSLCSGVASAATQGSRAARRSAGPMAVRSPFKALYRRELKRFFSLTLLITNTMFGMLFVIVLAAVLLIGGGIEGLLGAEGVEMMDVMLLDKIIPTIIGVLVCMSCTTCTSVSLEGKQFWLLRSLPTDAWTILRAKILTNLTLTVPASVLCGALIAIAQNADPLFAAMLIVIPLIYSVFSALFGLFVNLKMPKLDWDSEVQAIKQSGAVLVGQMLPAIPTILFAVIAATLRSEAIAYLTALVPLAASVVLAALLKSRGERYLAALTRS